MAIAHPHRFRLKIDFDLQFSPSFSEKYQKHDQYQDGHKAVPLSTPVDLQTPLSRRGFCISGVHGLHAKRCPLQLPE